MTSPRTSAARTLKIPRARKRSGAIALEAALVAPLLILVLFGAIDIGQYVNVAQSISNASREGARVASRDRVVSTTEVSTAVINYFAQTFPNLTTSQIRSATTVVIRDEAANVAVSGDMSTIASGSPISVSVQFNFAAVRWIPGINWWSLTNKQTRTFARRE